MADTVEGKIEEAVQAAKDFAKKGGESVKDGSEAVTDKEGDAVRATGHAGTAAGRKLKHTRG